MGEHGVRDYRLAKEKAAHHLGAPSRAAWPTNREIATALKERQSLFGGAAHLDLQFMLRQQAARAMRRLEDFSPVLTGAVLEGTATTSTPVVLHLLKGIPEAVEEQLAGIGLSPRMAQKRLRLADQRHVYRACLEVTVDGTAFELIVLQDSDLSSPPLCPVTGRPARRMHLRGLLALIEEQ